MECKKSIVLINQSSGYLMTDIANAYFAAGYQVCLVSGKLVHSTTALHKAIKTVTIARYNNKNVFLRLFSWLFSTIQIFFLITLKFRTEQLLIVSNPPFAPLLGGIVRNKFSLLIYDIYPEVLVSNGIIKESSAINKIWKRINRIVYVKAQNIYTLTPGMKRLLMTYAPDEKIKVVPVWADTCNLYPIPRSENEFIKTHNLQDKFVVLYSGNFGNLSGVEFLVDVASLLNTNEDILFLFIGDGVKKSLLKNKIAEYGLNNCMILPWQKKENLNRSLSSSSLSVVMLGRSSSQVALPSKLFNYMAVSSPILSIASNDSDLCNLVNHRNIGQSFEQTDINSIAEFILKLSKDRDLLSYYSSNSNLISRDFTSDNAKKIIE